MDVEVPLQLIPDGLAEKLQAVVGCLGILLCARANRYPLGGVIVGHLVAQGATRVLMTPGTLWRAVTTSPTCTIIQGLTYMLLV